MAALTLTSFDKALKEYYTDQRVKNMVYEDNPLLAMIPKMESFAGRNLPIVIQHGVAIGGRSATFGTAVTNKAPGRETAFLLTRVQDYGLADIMNEAMEASSSDKGAFMQARITEINGVLHALTRSLATAMYRSGTGSLCQIGAITATTVTCSPIDAVTCFEVDQVLVGSLNDGGTLRAGGAAAFAKITAVNRDTGVLTIDTNMTGGGDPWLVNDFLYVQGDAQAGGGSLTKLAGLAAWCPAAAPGATAFFGVDRSVDPVRLGGIRYDGTGETVQEALIGASVRARREGRRPDVCFMNHLHVGQLLRSLEGTVQRSAVSASDAAISFEAIVLNTPNGPVKVIGDHNCPPGVAYLLTLSTWKLYSLGAAPKILKPDGLTVLRNSQTDSVEVRAGYYANVGCSQPGSNVRIALSTT